MTPRPSSPIFFFFNDTATTEIYTLSLHDALPISFASRRRTICSARPNKGTRRSCATSTCRIFIADRKSTRLNSSHSQISYAVFCLKKKKKKKEQTSRHVEARRAATHACRDNTYIS